MATYRLQINLLFPTCGCHSLTFILEILPVYIILLLFPAERKQHLEVSRLYVVTLSTFTFRVDKEVFAKFLPLQAIRKACLFF
jgi:hypothetical protein